MENRDPDVLELRPDVNALAIALVLAAAVIIHLKTPPGRFWLLVEIVFIVVVIGYAKSRRIRLTRHELVVIDGLSRKSFPVSQLAGAKLGKSIFAGRAGPYLELF